MKRLDAILGKLRGKMREAKIQLWLVKTQVKKSYFY